VLGNTQQSYGWVSIILHWVTAIVVILLFAAGLWMEDFDYDHPLYKTVPHLHKSFGVLLVSLVVVRLVWRFSQPRPESLPNHKTWEKRASKIAHGILYLFLLLMLPSGYFITTAAGQGLDVFSWFTIPSLIDDIDNLEDIAGEVHELIAFAMISVVFIHAAGAIKHHFYDKDMTLKRMLGRSR